MQILLRPLPAFSIRCGTLRSITVSGCSNKLQDEVFPVCQVPESLYSCYFLVQDERIYHTQLQ